MRVFFFFVVRLKRFRGLGCGVELVGVRLDEDVEEEVEVEEVVVGVEGGRLVLGVSWEVVGGCSFFLGFVLFVVRFFCVFRRVIRVGGIVLVVCLVLFFRREVIRVVVYRLVVFRRGRREFSKRDFLFRDGVRFREVFL